MFKKFNENKKKGFTLVELIVVLVILAILAALLIPALTGYIDKAKRKSLVAETRQAVMAAQTLVDEAYGKVDPGTEITVGGEGATVQTTDVEKLAELSAGSVSDVTVDTTTMKVTGLKYTSGNKTCTYKPDNKNNSDGDYDCN